MPPAAFPSSSRPTTALRMAAEAVEVPMELIKKLRGMSGAPIMDCKKALAEEKLGTKRRVGREGASHEWRDNRKDWGVCWN